MNTRSLNTVRRLGLATGSAALAASLIVAPVAMASRAQSKVPTCRTGAGTKLKGKALCAALSFYKGKTLTIIAATVGGGFDTTARALMPALEQYLGGSVAIVNVPGGGGVPPEDQAARAIPDGLTIGFLFPLPCALGTLTNTPFVNFNPKHVAFVAGTGASVQVLVANAKSSYKTFNSLKAPGAPAGTLTESLGTTYDTLVILRAMFKLNINFVTGYSSVGNVLQGFIRGDGPISIGSLSNFGPAVASGVATPLAVTARIPVGTDYRKNLLNTPTVAQLLNQLPSKTKAEVTEKTAFTDLLANTGQPIFTQSQVPAARVQILRDAVAWAYAQKTVDAALLFKGDTDVWVSPTKAKAEYDTSLVLGKSLVATVAKYL